MAGLLDSLPPSLRVDQHVAPLWRDIVAQLGSDSLRQPLRFISDHQHHLLIEGLLVIAILYQTLITWFFIRRFNRIITR